METNRNEYLVSTAPGALPAYTALLKYKVVFTGDIAVGKTSIITNFMYSTFDDNYKSTIGIDFLSRTMMVMDQPIRFQLWDTAGQERFHSLIPSYIRDCQAALIVYDITNRSSFDRIPYWVNLIQKERGDDSVIMIVGNKQDLDAKRVVSLEDAHAVASNFSALFCECSARINSTVNTLFLTLSEELLRRHPPDQFKSRSASDIVAVSPSSSSSNASSSSSSSRNGCGC